MKWHGCSTYEAQTSISIQVSYERVLSNKVLTNLFLVFFAYAVVTKDKTLLFIRQEQLNDAARQYLGDHVEIKPYDSFFDYLKGLAGTLDLGAESVRLSFSHHVYIQQMIEKKDCRKS